MYIVYKRCGRYAVIIKVEYANNELLIIKYKGNKYNKYTQQIMT